MDCGDGAAAGDGGVRFHKDESHPHMQFLSVRCCRIGSTWGTEALSMTPVKDTARQAAQTDPGCIVHQNPDVRMHLKPVRPESR